MQSKAKTITILLQQSEVYGEPALLPRYSTRAGQLRNLLESSGSVIGIQHLPGMETGRTVIGKETGWYGATRAAAVQRGSTYKCHVCRIPPRQDQICCRTKAILQCKSWEITKYTTIPYGCGVPWVFPLLCQDPSLFSKAASNCSVCQIQPAAVSCLPFPSQPPQPAAPRNVVLERCLMWLTPSLSSQFPGMPAVFHLFYVFHDVSILHCISWLAS